MTPEFDGSVRLDEISAVDEALRRLCYGDEGREPLVLEVCEAALVSGAVPISFRRNLGTVKVKGVGDVCYPSLWCGADQFPA
ncbi:hypothetical protein F2Q68_00007082 [Brassica cretica]|uniref:Uncharacterized protein n=1 Tax=Brassica cretica TaxID=69181 RepID=A0A8S9KR86_BRACR|nr:hypothetical protein F2Q68_00007082 [Brassica cretica]